MSMNVATVPAPADTGSRIAAIYAGLAVFNAGVWLWAWLSFHGQPVLLGTALLAYSFGLRHAVDADHIAAIDNVTRKLMQQGQRPVAVGLMFSLGHSTVVVAGALAIAGAALGLQAGLGEWQVIGGVIGTLVSAGFLFAIALVNLVVLRSVARAFRRVRRGEPYVEADFNLLFSQRGFLARIFKPLFGMINRSRDMFLLGLLFGLGFDTATEIGLLGVAAAEASRGLSLLAILVFPLLFAAGMALVDASDSILMLGAYGWAFVKPVRKLYYNLTITWISALIAIAVGGIELLGLLGDQLHYHGWFWRQVAGLNAHMGRLGYGIVATFVFCWLAAIALYKWRRLDELEVETQLG